MCEHENNEVLSSTIVEVSKYGTGVLFELIVCLDCGHRWIKPYLELNDIDPIPDDFVVKEYEDKSPLVLPSLDYIVNVIGISKTKIPKELIAELSGFASGRRSTE